MENNKIAPNTSDQAPEPELYTEEEVEAIWRRGVSGAIEAYHVTVLDLLPEAVRNHLTAWFSGDFSNFKYGCTDKFPALPSFQIQRMEGEG